MYTYIICTAVQLMLRRDFFLGGVGGLDIMNVKANAVECGNRSDDQRRDGSHSKEQNL